MIKPTVVWDISIEIVSTFLLNKYIFTYGYIFLAALRSSEKVITVKQKQIVTCWPRHCHTVSSDRARSNWR